MPHPRTNHDAPFSSRAPSVVEMSRRGPNPVRGADAAFAGDSAVSDRAPDEELVQLLVWSGCGDREAFARLYDLTSPRMFALAAHQAPHAAEALTLGIYVALWSAAPRYAPGAAHPLAWMVALAHHTLAEQVPGTAAPALSGALAPKWGPSAAPVAKQTAIASRSDRAATSAQLTRVQHEILTLVHLGGYSHRQVAELLRLPAGSVTAAAQEGRRRLARRLPLQPEPAAS